jgi:hypothetical protein
MWRWTRSPNRFNNLKVGLFSAVALMILYACAETTSPAKLLSTNGIIVTEFQYPDSVKYPADAVRLANASAARPVSGSGLSATLWSSSSVALAPSSPSASLASLASVPSYTVAAVAYAPEAAPTLGKGPVCDDCLMSNIPMGFEFTFFGKVYDKINIGSNGLVGFGNYMRDGCCSGSVIPANDFNNNIIALGQSDWIPNRTTSIRYETRGSAPNRRFLVQFLDVMESSGSGVLTVQLVLYEQSNDIVIYTKALSTSIKSHVLTQGIENLTGDEAVFIPGRVAAKYALANDAVKFSVTATNKAPVITAPANISVNTAAASCAANVDVGSATATDDAPGVTISGVRSDGLALDAAYPKGVTTITWTATDVENVKSSAPQTVTVSDKQSPTVKAPENKSVRANKGVSFASVDVGVATAADNCPNVTVTGARSDNAPLSAGYPLGVTTITWTAKDEAGNLGSATQTVSVSANQPPVIPVAPPALAVNTDPGVCSASLNPSAPAATDDLPGVVVKGVRNDVKDLNAPYPKGLTVITWTATDAEDASASVTQSVTVSDKEKPSIAAPANRSVGNDPGLATAMVAVGNAEAKDNCPSVSVSAVRSDGLALGSPYPVGSTSISWQVTDASSNSNAAVQTIVVNDITPPTINVPASFWVNAISPRGAPVSYDVSASDNVGVTSLSCVRASGSELPIGVSTVNCAASDAAGNRASASFTVTVRGAGDQLVDLIAYVSGLGLPNGSAQPLLNQLNAALRALNDNNQHVACIKLNDFIDLMGKKSSGVSAAQWSGAVGDAERIRAVLACQ